MTASCWPPRPAPRKTAHKTIFQKFVVADYPRPPQSHAYRSGVQAIWRFRSAPERGKDTHDA